MVYATLGVSAGIIILLAAALALLYWRCRSSGGATSSADRKRKQYSAMSTSEPEPEVSPSVSSQPSPTASNSWTQTMKRPGSDGLMQNGRGIITVESICDTVFVLCDVFPSVTRICGNFPSRFHAVN